MEKKDIQFFAVEEGHSVVRILPMKYDGFLEEAETPFHFVRLHLGIATRLTFMFDHRPSSVPEAILAQRYNLEEVVAATTDIYEEK